VKPEDSVGLGAYNMDSHNCRRIARDDKAHNEGDVQVGVKPYPISYRSIVPRQSECENLFVPAKQWRLDRRAEAIEAEAWIAELSIRSRGPETPIDALSGGNQQKLLLARALRRQPSLLLLDEPTAGVDVGAKADIHALVRRLAAGGAGILLASSDLPELLSLCDRIVALREGRVAGEVAVDADAEHRVGALITGAAEGRERAC